MMGLAKFGRMGRISSSLRFESIQNGILNLGTVSRASTHLDFGSDGLLDSYAANTAAIGWDPVTGELRGME